MEVILGYNPLSIAVIAILTIVLSGIVTMYLLVRHKRNNLYWMVSMLSILCMMILVFHLMNVALSPYKISQIYHQLEKITIVIACAWFIICIVFFIIKMNKNAYFEKSVSILSLFSRVEAVVIVTGKEGNISYVNHPEELEQIFGDVKNIKEIICSISKLSQDQDDRLFNDKVECLSEKRFSGEFFSSANETYYAYKMNPIRTKQKQYLGNTIVFEDISDIRLQEIELEEQNKQLLNSNQKLKNYVNVAVSLEAEEERLRLLEEIQMTLIQDIEGVLEEIELLKKNYFSDDSYQSDFLILADKLRQIYQTVRKTVGKISKRGNET